ncbi:MAG: xanthine dehydrogenase family protein subunit M [Parvibaculaceae bacterium]
MKPAAFDYARAESADHAVEELRRHAGDARLLAGGQSLVPMMNLRLARPSVLIDIGGLPLAAIAAAPGAIEIGALARHRAVLADAAVAAAAPIIPAAVRHVGHPTVRNLGTAGGSIAYADPTAEMAALLVLLDGEVRTQSADGSRTIAAEDFFRGAFTTALGDDEMIVALRFRPPAAPHGSAFVEIAERHGDYAIAAVGVTIVAEGDTITQARIVLSGAEGRPVRARAAESMLQGERPEGEAVRAAAASAVAGRSSYGDIRASAEYRRSLLEALTLRAIRQAGKEAMRCSASV